MKKNDNAYLNAEKALAVAYDEKPEPLGNEMWDVKTMSKIMRIGPHNNNSDFFELFGEIVWRHALVACICIVVLSVALFNIGIFPEDKIAILYMDDSVNYTCIRFFGKYGG